VACQARKAGINFRKEGNCFTQISDAAGLAKIADTLSGPQAVGRLSQVCERLDLYHLLVFRETIKTILGYQRRPRYRQRKSQSAQWGVAVEKLRMI
jgi:hypothetical protein